MQSPSSLKATAPACTMSPISASSLPARPLVRAPDRVNARVRTTRARLTQNKLYLRIRIKGRLGVRHAGHRRKAAGRRSRRASFDRLFLFLARLPQVHVHIDQARRYDATGRVKASSAVERAAEGGNDALGDDDVRNLVDLLAGIDYASAANQNRLAHTPRTV